MKKFALFAFNGEPMCFVHVMLTGIDMLNKGYDVKIIIEGSATALITKLVQPENPFHQLYKQIIDKDLIHSVCMACSAKMDVLDEVKKQMLPLGNDMKGHPSMTAFIEKGYEIITF